jgi:hypothetical protein
MADFNFGIQNTEEFSMEDNSALESFLNGEVPKLEKLDTTRKEDKKEEKKPVKPPVKTSKAPEEEEEEETQEEESIDVLEALEAEDNAEEESSTKKEKSEPEGEEEDVNNYEVLSEQLYDLGIFTTDEEGERVVATSGEELASLFQQNAHKMAVRNLDNFLRQRGEDRMELFEAIFVNGVDPSEYLPVYNQVQNFEQLDMSIEGNQEKVFREYYRRLNWDSNKIETKLQKAKDYGDLPDDSEEILSKILEQDKESLKQQEEKAKLQDLQKKQAEQQYQASVQAVVVEAMKAKELDGFPVTEGTAKAVYNFLVQPKYKLPNGEVITEYDKWHLESKRPENIKQRALIALLQLNKFDFSKIEKKAISKESNELFSRLKKSSVKSKTQKPAQTDNFWNNL